MSPAPTARARPSRSCARSWRPRACASTSTPRRISCASTSAFGSVPRASGGSSATMSSPTRSPNASASMPARRSPCSRSRRRPAFLLFARHPADVLLLEVGSRRTARRHQCRRPPAGHRHHAGLARPCGVSRRHLGEIAAEKAGILKRGVPAVVAAQPREALAVIERQAARVKAPLQDRRRGLDRDRGARPARLSGRRRPARPAGAEAARPPSVRECRRRHRRAARGRRARAAAAAFETGIAKADWPARMQRLSQGRLAALVPAGSELWLDGGHNPDGGARHRQRARRSRGARVAAAGAGRRHAGDQGQRSVLAEFHRARPAHRAVPIPQQEKSLPADAIADVARAAGIPAEAPRASRRRSPRSARFDLDPPPRILITGSLYLAGEVLKANGTLPT